VTAPALLRVDGLAKRFGGVAASDGVSLDVAQGEFHALIGPNGAGKSTLINQLHGALRPDAGRVLFDGADITALPPHARALRGIARSYQVTNVFARLSARDGVALALQAVRGSSFRFWRPVWREAGLFAEADRLLERVGLGARADVPAGVLAHGEQRQLEIALALASRPRLLLLDEPLAGTGPDESERLLHLIESLRGSVTVLLVEHDMDAVFRLADRISVLVYGRVIASGAPEAIRADPQVRSAYLGEPAAAHVEARAG
jgi:branched-chain amino acid transport system ATP-binding protein